MDPIRLLEEKHKKEIVNLCEKIRYLEDYNFILYQKCNAYEYILKYLLYANNWTHTLLSYIIDYKNASSKSNFIIADELMQIPYKLVNFVKENTFQYEKKLNLLNLYPKFNFIHTDPFNLINLNDQLILLNDYTKSKFREETDLNDLFPEGFKHDLNLLLTKHGIDLDFKRFAKSLDASILLYSLIKDVFIHIPFTITEFNPDDIASSMANIKKWIRESFKKFTVRLGENYFFVEPNVIIKPILENFFTSSMNLVNYKDTFLTLIKEKRNTVAVYSQDFDLKCFDNFINSLEKIFLDFPVQERLSTNSDQNLIYLELLYFINLCLSMPADGYLEFDYVRHNYFIENYFLKKFLISSLLFNNIEPTRVMHPIKILSGFKYMQNCKNEKQQLNNHN